MSTEQFQFASDFARKGRLVVGFQVAGERFDLVVPKDGRCIPLVLGVELEDMMDFFHATMRRESFDRFEDLVYDFDNGLEISQIATLYHHSITLLCGGRPYWTTQSLVGAAMHTGPQFQGEMILDGVRPMRLPLHEFVDLVYAWLTKDADRDQREKFDAQIAKPPAGVEAELLAEQPEWAEAGNAFLASMASRGSR